MTKLLLIFAAIVFTACNTTSTPDAKATDSASQPKPSADVSKLNDTEFSFLDDCVEGSKARLGEAKAFELCKCILPQVEAKYPTLDSASSEALAKDTAEMVRMMKVCE